MNNECCHKFSKYTQYTPFKSNIDLLYSFKLDLPFHEYVFIWRYKRVRFIIMDFIALFHSFHSKVENNIKCT